MNNLFTFAFFASALCLASTNSQQLKGPAGGIPALPLPSVSQPLQAAEGLLPGTNGPSSLFPLKNLMNPPTPIISQVLPVMAQPAPVKQTARLSFKRVKVYGYLADTLKAILLHTNTIRKLTAGAESANVEDLSWKLVNELQQILLILNGCLHKVKDCGSAPTPSGIPGGKIPTLDDICQLFFKIMCEIRDICKLIGSLCIKYKRVRGVCQDTLKQITGCLASIAVRCGTEVGSLSTGLGRLFANFPNFFIGVEFGFGAFPSILGDGYGSLSFHVSL